jgi:hypothetical protein
LNKIFLFSILPLTPDNDDQLQGILDSFSQLKLAEAWRGKPSRIQTPQKKASL